MILGPQAPRLLVPYAVHGGNRAGEDACGPSIGAPETRTAPLKGTELC